ncbi:MAG: cell division protein FtsZ [Saprospiraceae bacterium]|nr:cell division protein FtsZ [Saprospiraceae bacterium]MDZ4705063.1 cell division protein FtsZ [Saprospiraceae bacterium]
MLFDLPGSESPIIKVLGVGGGGSNAVNHMYSQGIIGVDFAICNTDAQAMDASPVPTKISLGPLLTEGRGAGSKPNIGKLACEESIEELRRYLENNCKMLFITAGMGGGTGTGAAPIIAKTAKEMGILTVGIITLPFGFEGRRRQTQGGEGLSELKKYVDTLIVISNDKLRLIYGNLSLSDAFSQADNILTTAAKGIAEIITVPGYVNVDFEDVNTVMRDSGVAIMGTATAEGENRAKRAVDEALHSPLLEENNIRGAQHILLNITSGTKEVTMDEIFEITEFVQEEAGNGTDLIWGNCFDEKLGEKISVTIIATGFEQRPVKAVNKAATGTDRIVVSLDDDPDRQGFLQKKTKLSDLGFEESSPTEQPTTFEFDNIRSSIYQRSRYNYDEPAPRNDVRDQQRAEEERRLQERENMRRERLRSNVVKLSNPQTINDLESEPAYMRRGVNLDDVPNSAEPAMSKWTISDDDDPELREGNSFLHDNVD